MCQKVWMAREGTKKGRSPVSGNLPFDSVSHTPASTLAINRPLQGQQPLSAGREGSLYQHSRSDRWGLRRMRQ